MQEMLVQSLGQEDHLEKEMQPTPVFLPGKFHGPKSLVGYSPWGHKELNMAQHLKQMQQYYDITYVRGAIVFISKTFCGVKKEQVYFIILEREQEI